MRNIVSSLPKRAGNSLKPRFLVQKRAAAEKLEKGSALNPSSSRVCDFHMRINGLSKCVKRDRLAARVIPLSALIHILILFLSRFEFQVVPTET